MSELRFLLLIAFATMAFNLKGQSSPQLRRSGSLIDSLNLVLASELNDLDRASTLLAIGKYHQYLDSAKALNTFKELIPLAERLENPHILGNVYFLKGGIFRNRLNSQLALSSFVKARELFLLDSDTLYATLMQAEIARLYTFYFNDQDTSTFLLNQVLTYIRDRDMPSRKAWCLDMISNNYRRQDNHLKALEYLQKSYDIREEYGDTTNMAKKLSTMGNIHFVMDNYDKAIGKYRRSIQMLSALEVDVNTNLWLKSNNLNIGLALLNQEKPDEAFPYLMLADSLKNHARGVNNSILIHGIGLYYFKKGNLDSAMHRYQDALQMARKNKRIIALPKVLNGIASIHVLRNDYDAALRNVKESIDISERHNQPDHLSKGLKLLSEIYSSIGNHKLAYQYHLEYHDLFDSLLNEDKIRSMTTLENRFAFENEKQELAQRQKEKELILQAEIKQQQLIQNGSFVGLGILLIVALVSYRFYQTKKRDNLMIQEQSDQLKLSNKELLELSNYKQGLTQMIAHDMKNPLNVIISLSGNSRKKEDLQEIEQSGKMMLHMVNNMLDIQRFEETKMQLKSDHYELNQLVLTAKYQVELLLMAKSIDFNSHISTELSIYGDQDLIVRVFVNLYTNAIKYMAIGGSLTIDAEESNGRVRVSIKDTGIGIPEELQAHIFDKFWQSDPKKYGMTTSNGLGLTFCKLAVIAHGGEISVESKPGIQTTFYFDLEKGQLGQVKACEEEFVVPGDAELSEADEQLIERLAAKLRQIPIYKSSKIEEVLRELEPYDSIALQRWKMKLRQASYSFDNQAFDELLS